MATFTVVLDANVLYSYTLRDAVMWLSLTDLFRVRWSEHIHREWIGALERKGHNRAKLERIRAQMELHHTDALVTHYESLIQSVSLPDPDDRHVVAAAIRANADTIVTFNPRHFPRDTLANYEVEVMHPDDFIRYQIGLSGIQQDENNQESSAHGCARSSGQFATFRVATDGQAV